MRCWGANEKGQLGDGHGGPQTAAVDVAGIDDAVDVSAAGAHGCLLRADGSAWCWGKNDAGQLGDGSLVSRPAPVKVGGVEGATAIAVGWDFSCALLGDQSVTCWGQEQAIPKKVAGVAGITSLRAGHGGACGTTGGKVVCMTAAGAAEHAELGTSVVAASGWVHVCAADAAGTVVCSGSNDAGQLGTGSLGGKGIGPSLYLDAIDLSAGPGTTCAITKGAEALCWGANKPSPTPLGVPGVAAVAQSFFATCAVDGAGDTRCGEWLQPLKGVPSASGAAKPVVGDYFACVLTKAGKVRCWGSAEWGVLGDGHGFALTPVPVVAAAP